MSEREYNHITLNADTETALILGTEIRALCGEQFVPVLRVGSSGRADDPDLELCPRCDRIHEIRTRQCELSDECEALNDLVRDLRAEWASERETAKCG